jgi:hypothetical protein
MSVYSYRILVDANAFVGIPLLSNITSYIGSYFIFMCPCFPLISS